MRGAITSSGSVVPERVTEDRQEPRDSRSTSTARQVLKIRPNYLQDVSSRTPVVSLISWSD